MMIDVYVMARLLYNMYLLFFVQIGVLVVEIKASNELSWPKCRCCLLQQRDGLRVMRLGWLMVVNRVKGDRHERGGDRLVIMTAKYRL